MVGDNQDASGIIVFNLYMASLLFDLLISDLFEKSFQNHYSYSNRKCSMP